MYLTATCCPSAEEAQRRAWLTYDPHDRAWRLAPQRSVVRYCPWCGVRLP